MTVLTSLTTNVYIFKERTKIWHVFSDLICENVSHAQPFENGNDVTWINIRQMILQRVVELL